MATLLGGSRSSSCHPPHQGHQPQQPSDLGAPGAGSTDVKDTLTGGKRWWGPWARELASFPSLEDGTKHFEPSVRPQPRPIWLPGRVTPCPDALSPASFPPARPLNLSILQVPATKPPTSLTAWFKGFGARQALSLFPTASFGAETLTPRPTSVASRHILAQYNLVRSWPSTHTCCPQTKSAAPGL